MEMKDLNFKEVASEMKLIFQAGEENIVIPCDKHFGFVRIIFEYNGKGVEVPLYIETLFQMYIKHGFHIDFNRDSNSDLTSRGT